MQPVFQTSILIGYLHKIQPKSDKRVKQ